MERATGGAPRWLAYGWVIAGPVLQGVFDVGGYLTTWWTRLGYHLLTVLFVGLTLIYGYAALA